MEAFIEQAKMIQPGHPLHKKSINIHIKDGIIVGIDPTKKYHGKKIAGHDLYVSSGWVDIGVQCGEPGYEHRETLKSLSMAAAKGGYTTLIVFPNTKPVLHSKSEIEFIFQKSKSLQTEIIPIGCISKNAQGKELAEMIDMHQSGAIAFSDGKHAIQDTGLMQRAMIYLKHFNGLLINQPQDEALSGLGQMHEGIMSQQLGLKGIPAIAEVIMLLRDIQLAEYSGVRYLAHLLSSASSLSKFKTAKKSNPKLFASVSYLNLVMNDKSLEAFDSLFKQSPPLRSETDQKALQKAVKDGTIDIIVSNHTPLEIEKKDLEFAYAEHGALGLQTAFAAVHSQGLLSPEEWVTAVSINPRRILNILEPTFELGQSANLTVFDAKSDWTFFTKDIASVAKNTLFNEQKFTGKVLATFSKGHAYLSE